MGVNLHELEDYIHNIEPVTFAHQIPSFPVSKNNVLQFPPPGSKDAEERKEYIPDYLPPIVSSQEGAKLILCFQFWCVWVFVGIPQQLELCCSMAVAQEGPGGCYTSRAAKQVAVLWEVCFPLFLLSFQINLCQKLTMLTLVSITHSKF